jgi:putative membrane protein
MIVWNAIFLCTFLWSAINPHDYFTWFLEVFPAIIAFLTLMVTYNSFKMTRLVYILILIHCVILMIGGHYTYAEVPFFDNLFGFSRNNYDKLGHFAQGFIPALIVREVIIRKKIIMAHFWQSFFTVSFCLAFSAFYEILEWFVAVTTGDSAEAFLGTQGYVWDTQSDMFCAFIGAIIGIICLSKTHDTHIQSIQYKEIQG